jgi:hypothetical protein
MKIISLAASVILIFTGACTPRADAISPVSMTGAYDGMPCSKAKNQLATERVKLAALEKKQNGAATGDAIGVFLILVPVSKLTGGRSSDLERLGTRFGTARS